MNIGKRLKDARRRRKITQSELAEQIGVSRGVITNIELDKVKIPQPIVTKAICNALRISPDWLLDGKGDMDVRMGSMVMDSDMTEELSGAIDDLMTDEQALLLQIIQLMRKK